MSNKAIAYILVLVVGAMGLLVAINIPGIFGNQNPETYFSFNDVNGMEVEHAGKQYTLNFEQQHAVARLLNGAVKIDAGGAGQKESFPYTSVTIFLFGKPNIIIRPVSLAGQQLIFQAPALNPKGYLRETGPGELHSLLLTAYDE